MMQNHEFRFNQNAENHFKAHSSKMDVLRVWEKFPTSKIAEDVHRCTACRLVKIKGV